MLERLFFFDTYTPNKTVSLFSLLRAAFTFPKTHPLIMATIVDDPLFLCPQRVPRTEHVAVIVVLLTHYYETENP
jgi:hypothetical protein